MTDSCEHGKEHYVPEKVMKLFNLLTGCLLLTNDNAACSLSQLCRTGQEAVHADLALPPGCQFGQAVSIPADYGSSCSLQMRSGRGSSCRLWQNVQCD